MTSFAEKLGRLIVHDSLAAPTHQSLPLTLPHPLPSSAKRERGDVHHLPVERQLFPPTATAHGPVQLVDRLHGPGFTQGRIALSPARTASGRTLAALALDQSLARVDASRMLFVDTETTGLHGGAGTLPFLVGLAWFEGDSLVVRQLFLGQPGEERPLLHLLAERLDRASLLVTFNGKCFDWPLLRTRFVLNRLTPPVPPPHLDLLHCARRVFKRRLRSTRLQDLEAAVLGFHREGDLDGAEIPSVYFDWLRRGARGRLEIVLEHNVRDVVSMAAVLTELCRRFDAPEAADDPADCLSLAVLALRADEPERAEAFALAAVERAVDDWQRHQALVVASRCAEARRDWGAAAARAEAAVQLDTHDWLPRAKVHLSLARLYERRLRDPVRALLHARLASVAEPVEANARRIERLARRVGHLDGVLPFVPPIPPSGRPLPCSG